jgi:hypothetical protein
VNSEKVSTPNLLYLMHYLSKNPYIAWLDVIEVILNL